MGMGGTGSQGRAIERCRTGHVVGMTVQMVIRVAKYFILAANNLKELWGAKKYTNVVVQKYLPKILAVLANILAVEVKRALLVADSSALIVRLHGDNLILTALAGSIKML